MTYHDLPTLDGALAEGVEVILGATRTGEAALEIRFARNGGRIVSIETLPLNVAALLRDQLTRALRDTWE
jgi:hypothetical protein